MSLQDCVGSYSESVPCLIQWSKCHDICFTASDLWYVFYVDFYRKTMDRRPVKHRQHGIFARVGIFFMLSAGKKGKRKGKKRKRKGKRKKREKERKKEKLYSSWAQFLFPGRGGVWLASLVLWRRKAFFTFIPHTCLWLDHLLLVVPLNPSIQHLCRSRSISSLGIALSLIDRLVRLI